MLSDVEETSGRSAIREQKVEKEKRGDRIIEAAMKQGFSGSLRATFCLRSIKTPALEKEKTGPKLSGL